MATTTITSLQRQLQLQLLQVATVLQLLQLPVAVSLVLCIDNLIAECRHTESAYTLCTTDVVLRCQCCSDIPLVWKADSGDQVVAIAKVPEILQIGLD